MKEISLISKNSQALLKKSHPTIQVLVDSLINKIAVLQENNISLEVDNISLQFRVNALEKELKKYPSSSVSSSEELNKRAENLIKSIPKASLVKLSKALDEAKSTQKQ